MTRLTQDRFFQKIEADPVTHCWCWTGSTTVKGYGTFWFRNRISLAHRAAYELLRGPIPIGLQLDHLCRNRACVNPDHLEPVTHAENQRRGLKAQQTHCIHGHPFDEANTYIEKNGTRKCKACIRIRRRTRKATR